MTTLAAEATHFNWDEIEVTHPIPLIDCQRYRGERMMVQKVLLYKGFHLDSHHHENEQIVCVLSGSARFGVGEPGSPKYREIVVSGGEVLSLPPNVPHSADALEDTQIIDLFSPPAERTGLDS